MPSKRERGVEIDVYSSQQASTIAAVARNKLQCPPFQESVGKDWFRVQVRSSHSPLQGYHISFSCDVYISYLYQLAPGCKSWCMQNLINSCTLSVQKRMTQISLNTDVSTRVSCLDTSIDGEIYDIVFETEEVHDFSLSECAWNILMVK